MIRRHMVVSTALAVALIGSTSTLSSAKARVNASVATTRAYPGLTAPCNTTLQACITGSADGDTVSIAPGLYITAQISIAKAINIIGASGVASDVRLRPASGRMFEINAPSIITTPAVLAHLTIENAINTFASGGGLRVQSNSGIPLFQNLVISNNIALGGGGIRVVSTRPVTITDSLIFSNTTSPGGTGGGGISTNGPLTLINTRVEGNSTSLDGGGVEVDGAVVLSNSLVLNNRAGRGGGIFANGGLTLIDSRVEGNTATTEGGGIRASGTVVISNAQVLNNSAERGGGIFATSSLNLTGGSVLRANQATSEGGGIFAGQSASISRASVLSNTAGLRGGGLVVSNTAELRDGALLDSNRVISPTGVGGAVWVTGALTIDGSTTPVTLTRNVATLGGAIGGSGTVNAQLALFSANAANDAGAAACGGQCVFDRCVFTDNRAARQDPATLSTISAGGAISSSAALTVTRGSFFRNNAGSPGGGAIYATSGDISIENTLFNDNRIENSAGLPLAGSAIFGIGMGNARIVHNTFANSSATAPSVIGAGRTMAIVNNVFTTHTLGIARASGFAGSVFENANLWHSVATTGTADITHGTVAIVADPLFVNPAGGDFHVTSASPAIDAGVNVQTTIDVDGDARPIGPAPDIGYDETARAVVIPPKRVLLPLTLKP